MMYENSAVTIYGYIEAWTYHPMLNISVIPQRRYNLAPSVVKKLFNSETGGKVASITSGALRIWGTFWVIFWWLRTYSSTVLRVLACDVLGKHIDK